MADRTVNMFDVVTQQKVPIKAVDNGDGTYSLASALKGSAGAAYIVPLESGSLSISTTIKYVLGSATWTSLTDSLDVDKYLYVTNCDPSLPAYFSLLDSGSSPVGAVSSSLFDLKLNAGESAVIFVPADYDLIVVRTASGGAVKAIYYGAA